MVEDKRLWNIYDVSNCEMYVWTRIMIYEVPKKAVLYIEIGFFPFFKKWKS
jgi:hypothetical protein